MFRFCTPPATLSRNAHVRVVYRRWLAAPGAEASGSLQYPNPEKVKTGLVSRGFDCLFELLKQRKLKPIVAQRFSFAEVKRAHEMLVGGGVIGKIVLVSESSLANPEVAFVAATSDPSEVLRS